MAIKWAACSLQSLFVLCWLAGQAVSTDVNVRMQVFSGVRDPEWTVPRTFDHYQKLVELLSHSHPTNLSDALGYGGFDVHYTMTGERRHLTVGKCKNPPLEIELLNSAIAANILHDHPTQQQSVFTYVSHLLHGCH